MVPIDWQLIRVRFEGGQTPYAISRDLGGRPSKQGIAKRAKKEGWQVAVNGSMAIAERLPIVKQAQALTGPGKATAERVAFILELVGRGASIKLAASAAGINPKTLKRWQSEDPQLAEQIRQARAGKLAEWIAHIDSAAARDWKAADRLLQASPEAEDFSQQQHGGITVVLNIDRDNPDGVTIDSKPIRQSVSDSP
jgi:hypothetical protein